MSERDRFDELDVALSAVLAGEDVPTHVGAEARDLALIAAHLLGLPGEDFRARLKADLVRGTSEVPEPAGTAAPGGSQTVVPYLVVERAAELVDFVQRAFGAEELYRMASPEGGFHAEVRIGDANVMMGGRPGEHELHPAALHLYVADADATYRSAIEAGATAIYPMTDQPYGDREGGVRDPFGNTWYIASHRAGPSYIPRGLRSVTPFLQVRGADALLDFAHRAFGAEIVGRHADPQGVLRHAELRVSGSMIELGEAQGELPPIPAMLYVYVDDVDRWYERAVAAGSESIQAPADQPYGHRTGAVRDAFGNQWYMARPIPRSRT